MTHLSAKTAFFSHSFFPKIGQLENMWSAILNWKLLRFDPFRLKTAPLFSPKSHIQQAKQSMISYFSLRSSWKQSKSVALARVISIFSVKNHGKHSNDFEMMIDFPEGPRKKCRKALPIFLYFSPIYRVITLSACTLNAIWDNVQGSAAKAYLFYPNSWLKSTQNVGSLEPD